MSTSQATNLFDAPTASPNTPSTTNPVTPPPPTASPSSPSPPTISPITPPPSAISPITPPPSNINPLTPARTTAGSVTTPVPSTRPSPSPFLNLTPDIREVIYKHLLLTHRRPHQLTGRWSLHLGILRVNRQIHREALEYLHRHNSFTLLKLDKGADVIFDRGDEVASEAVRYCHVVESDTTVAPELVIRVFSQRVPNNESLRLPRVVVMTWDLPEICRQLTIAGDDYTMKIQVTLREGVSGRMRWWSLRCLAEVRHMQVAKLKGWGVEREGGGYEAAVVERMMLQTLTAGDVIHALRMYTLDTEMEGLGVYHKFCHLEEGVRYFEQIADRHCHQPGESFFSAEDGKRLGELCETLSAQMKGFHEQLQGSNGAINPPAAANKPSGKMQQSRTHANV